MDAWRDVVAMVLVGFAFVAGAFFPSDHLLVLSSRDGWTDPLGWKNISSVAVYKEYCRQIERESPPFPFDLV